jgi:hypothetical protein
MLIKLIKHFIEKKNTTYLNIVNGFAKNSKFIIIINFLILIDLNKIILNLIKNWLVINIITKKI